MISFFTNRNLLSSTIRAKQLAEYMGAKLNPTEGYENDVCVYIKPQKLEMIKDGGYVDVLDNLSVTEMMKTRPGVKVIAMGHPHAEWLKTFLKNEIIIIPHAHVNFENIHRDRKEVVTCGYVGTNKPYHIEINKEVGKCLEEVGFDFIPLFTYYTREDILDFYKKIDIQVIGYFDFHVNAPHYHEKKIVDAMSFGIPTVAGPKLGYKDVDDYYIHVNSMDELIKEVKKLREDKEYYKMWSEKGLKKAEEYHINNIAKLYQELK